ncbi:MAG: 2'-5' RNA ligase family protein [Alphaproteobacteria bacterium]|nr:2'-5' RNA ligase family protein [Alphaproteobacteria bacterium]MBV8411632.1 2'-5' RNA ligase family protein [Alphaproteobacteria bacterium]
MLYVVAWPMLAEADDTALRRLRAQYHPHEAELIGPHFTLVFGVPAAERQRLEDGLASLVGRRPFWFVLDRIVRHDSYLYATPGEGGERLVELYEQLNPTNGEPFEPHITLGLFAHAVQAEQVARIVERQHLPMHGRVEELALLSRDGEALEVMANVRL